MTKRKIRKLELNRETLSVLDPAGLGDVRGAYETERSVCNCPILSIGNCQTRQWTNCTTC
jgi:hypothetical protein